jgi:hypothetical protein
VIPKIHGLGRCSHALIGIRILENLWLFREFGVSADLGEIVSVASRSRCGTWRRAAPRANCKASLVLSMGWPLRQQSLNRTLPTRHPRVTN